MKLNNGTDIGNYTIENLVKLRDDLIVIYQSKIREEKEKRLRLSEMQAKVSKLLTEHIELQNEVIALGADVVTVAKSLENTVKKVQANN